VFAFVLAMTMRRHGMGFLMGPITLASMHAGAVFAAAILSRRP
jgi:hypothetical protein